MLNFEKNKKKENDFITAYDKYADDIYRHCYFRVYSKELAEDLTQETFIKTWKYIAEGKEVKNIRAFLYKVALNLIIDNSRKKKEILTDDPKETSVQIRLYDWEDKAVARFEYGLVVEAINGLDDHYRQVLTMRHVEGLPPSEIAEILDESPNAVSVRIHQATKKLRQIISEKYHTEKES